MFRNYLKVAWRNLLRNKVYSAINIGGLRIGLASCMLILLCTKDEVRYGQFHQKKDDLFQLMCHRTGENEDKYSAIAAMIQGPTFKRDIPEVGDPIYT